MHISCSPKLTFIFSCLLSENVALESLRTFNTSAGSHFETLGSATLCFHL